MKTYYSVILNNPIHRGKLEQYLHDNLVLFSKKQVDDEVVYIVETDHELAFTGFDVKVEVIDPINTDDETTLFPQPEPDRDDFIEEDDNIKVVWAIMGVALAIIAVLVFI